jgi:hypothetical protein
MSEDRELDAFTKRAQPRRQIPPVRLVLTIALLAFVAAVLVPTFDELLYAFRKDPGTDVGDAMSLPSGSVLPVGSRVRAHVVLGNRAAEIPLWRKGSLRVGPIDVRQTLGAPVFVEYERRLHPTWAPFVEAEVDGRVVDFSELEEAKALIEREGVEVPPDARVIIADERPGDMSSYLLVWTLGIALAIWSVLGLVRATRHRVVPVDDVA